jgi:MFS transporter, MHS family, proline/betaine transporter
MECAPVIAEPDELTHPTHLPVRLIAAGTVGNVMEWYDFAVYGYFAATIGRHFFPVEDTTTSLIAAFGVFAAGFLMRPLGGLVFGHVGDRVGRKAALTMSVLAMAIPTFLIGMLPGYATLGPVAAVLLVVLRMIQGLSVGGSIRPPSSFSWRVPAKNAVASPAVGAASEQLAASCSGPRSELSSL